MRRIFTFSAHPVILFVLVPALLLGSASLHAQTSMTQYVVFGGTSTPLPGQTAPAAPGYGVQFGFSTNIQGGSVGSYKLVKSVGNMTAGTSALKTNIYSGGTIVLANSNAVTGNIAAGIYNTPFAAGTIFSAGTSENFIGNININGNIVIGGGTVTGTVTNPVGTTYQLGAVIIAGTGTPTLPILPQMPAVRSYSAGSTNVTGGTINPGSYGSLSVGNIGTVTLSGPGTYIFQSISTSGPNSSIIYDFKNTATGNIIVYVVGDVNLNKTAVRIINGGDATRIYTEVHGTGSTNTADKTASFIMSNGSNGTGNVSGWFGSVWAPYAAIKVGAPNGPAMSVKGALWSGTQVNIGDGVTITYAPYVLCNLTSSTTSTNVLCNGGATGTISLTVSGGVGPYKFVWSGPNGYTSTILSSVSNVNSITGLKAGTYNVTFTDAAGCTATALPTIVTEPANVLSAAITAQTNVTCYGSSTGSVTVAGSGGISPYTYSLNGGLANATGTFNTLAANSYTVTVKDNNGCTVNVPVTITQPAALVISSIGSNSPICFGTTLNLNSSVTGGTGSYSYSWTGPNQFSSIIQNPVISNVTTAASGPYGLQVTDANGCIANTNNTVSVTVNPLPDVSAGPDKPFNFDGNTTLNGSSLTSGATFKWIAPVGGEIKTPADQANINAGAPGIYTLTVTAAGCSSTANVVVSNKVSNLIGSELTSIYWNNPNGVASPFFNIANGMVRIDIIVQVSNYDYVFGLLTGDMVNYGLKNTITNGVNGADGSKLIITGDYPIANLLKLNALNLYINFCRPFYAPFSNSGLVNSAGDTTMRSNLVRSGYKISGTGVKVGVISNSYSTITSGTTATLPLNPVPGAPQTFTTNTAAVDISNGDLPAVNVLLDYPGKSTDEGRAMLQIVHDVAPGADLYFRTGFLTAGDFATGIKALQAAGCNIIVDDVTYITEPYLKDGVVAKAVDEVKALGVTYFSAAGNFSNKSYEKDFTPFDATSAGFPGKMAHDFSGTGDIFQHITMPPGDYTIVLQWVDNIYSTGQVQGTKYDLDMFWRTTNTDGTTALKGFNRDNTNGDPLEILPFTITTNTVADFVIVNNSPATTVGNPARIKYIIYRGDVQIGEYNVGNSTVVGQANAAGAIAVGASRYDKAPPYLTTPLIESFSSYGGTKTEGAVRNKPDLVGPDGGNTTVKMGQDYPNSALDGYSNFFGTSAAAPHAAAAAALIMEGRKKFILNTVTTSPDYIRSLLQTTAVDMETSNNQPGTNFDFISGFGLVNADSAMRTFAAPVATLINVVVPPLVVPCNGTPFNVTITGENFNYNTIVLLVNAPADTTRIVPTFISPTAVSVTVSSCVGNPEIMAYTPPKAGTNGTDGGFSNSKYFFSAAITITANNITKKYGETLVAPSAIIKVNGVLLQNTNPLLSLQDIGLDNPNLVLTTAATSNSDVGTYIITPSRTFVPTNATDAALQKKYSYQFYNGAVTIAKMPLIVTPDNKIVTYGKSIGNITYTYNFTTTNIYNPDSLKNAIKTYHQALMPTNALAVIKDFNKQQANGTVLSNLDLANMNVIASFNAVKNSRKFSLSNNTLIPIPAGSSLLQDNLNIQYLVDVASESIYNYRIGPTTSKFINAYSGISSKAFLSAAAMESEDFNIGTVNVNGSLLKVVSGSLEQMVSTSNGLVAPILNGLLMQVVDGVTIPATDGLVQYVNDGSWVQITSGGTLVKVVNGLLKLVNGTLLKVVSGVSYVQFTNGTLLKVVSGSLLKVVSGTNTVVYQDGSPVLDSTLVMLPNGLAQVTSGSLLKVVSGSLLKVVSGSLLKVVSGSLLKVVSGSQLGTDAPNNNTAVILDSADAGDGSGAFSPGSMFGINMITGLGVGKQYLVPGVLANPNFDITYGLGEVDITKASLIVRADDKTRKYGENNPVLTVSYSGFVNNEDSLSSGIKGVNNAGIPSATTAATQYTPVSPPTYQITAALGTLASSSNYAYSFVNGALTITSNQCLITHDSTNFVSTSNPGTPTSLWLNITVKISGQLVTNGDYLIFRAGGITFNSITSNPNVTDLAIPNGKIVADNSVSSPITNYDAATNTWITKVPVAYASTSDIFVTGAIINSSTGFAAKNSKANSVLKGMFYSNKSFSDKWSYAMAAYQPQFAYSAIAAPGAVTSINGTYRAGTPTTVIASIVGGGTGNGGSNYTGSSSNQNAFTACIPSSLSVVNRAITSTSLLGAVGQAIPDALTNKQKMEIYPNPASNHITLSFVPGSTGTSKISLFTIDERKVMEINNGILDAGKNYVKNIDVSKLVRGMYLIQLSGSDKITIKKVIIAR